MHIIREGITVEAYVSIRNRNPPLYTGPNYEEKEKKFMMISITMIISFPSVLMINSYSYQTLKQHYLPSTKKILTTQWKIETYKRKVVLTLTFFTHGQTSQLFCTVYQLTEFYMTRPSVTKGLSLFFTLDPSCGHWKSVIVVGL